MTEPSGGVALGTYAAPLFVSQQRDLDVELPNGWSAAAFVGRRLNVPTGTTADVWSGTAVTRPLPLAPLGMSVVSTAAGDDVATALGAQTAVVSFLDENKDWRISDVLELDGLTPVPITYDPTHPLWTDPTGAGKIPPATPGGVTASIFRVQSVGALLAAGATEANPKLASNVGIIRVVDTATATVVYDAIPIGRGVGQSGAFTVPRLYEALLTRWVAGTRRGSGEMSFAAALGGPPAAWSIVTFSSVDSGTAPFTPDPATAPIPPLTDVVTYVLAGSNNIDVNTTFQVRLRPLSLAPVQP